MLGPSAFLPSPGTQLGTRRPGLLPQLCHHLLVTLVKTLVSQSFSKVLSSLVSVASGFPWDLVCLSAEAKNRISSHPMLLVTTKGRSLGSGDGGQGLRILVLSVAAKAEAVLLHTPLTSTLSVWKLTQVELRQLSMQP